MRIGRIISGGQTGADRAALDAALARTIPCGGWVPKGRTAEDGIIPDRYLNLRECDESAIEKRTELNVLEADATLILSHGPLHGGSALTKKLAEQHGKPVLHVDLNEMNPGAAVSVIAAWLTRVEGSTLNVAGPRLSDDPEIYRAARLVIDGVIATAGLVKGKGS